MRGRHPRAPADRAKLVGIEGDCVGKAISGRRIELGGHNIIVGPIFTLLFLIGIAAIFVWLADWASGGRDLISRRRALENLNQRFARGEIDTADYEAKRQLIGGEQ